VIDHINQNKLNNRRNNLRVCSRSENGANRSIPKTNTSGYKGVYRIKNKWMAQIGIKNKSIYLGCFDEKVDAAIAYDTAATKAFGAFARLNFP